MVEFIPIAWKEIGLLNFETWTNVGFLSMTLCSCPGNLASMLEISRKRKQLTKASCGTCGGRPLVDGIEPEPASMLSTVDLELTNFINSDLTWKKVKKGCRSTNRRSRKLITSSLNVGVELGNMSRKRDQDSSVSESEKLGVAVLGRRFAEKVVDVPIKKRRFLIQSPSPPPRTSSLDQEEFLSHQTQTLNPEESEQLVDSKLATAGRRCSQDLHSDGKKRAFNKSEALKFTQSVDGVWNGKKSEVTNGVCDYDDDFSGIQLLAAAACSSSIDDDAVNIKEKSVMEGSVKAEGIDSPSAAIPFKESIASSGTCNFSEKDLVNEDDMGDSFVEGSTISVSVNLNKIENGGIVKNRAHWDLNTVMEAWEEPSDDPLVNSKINNPKCVINDGLQCEKFSLESCDIPRNLEDTQCDIERGVQSVVRKKVSSDLEGNQILEDPSSMVDATARSCLQEDKLKVCSSPKGISIEKKYVTTATESVPESLNYAAVHKIASTPVMTMEASRDYCCPGSHHTASSHVFEGKMNTSASDLEQMGEDSSGTSVAESIKSLSGSSQAGKLDILSPDMPQLNKSASEIDGTQTKDSEDFEKTHGLPGCRTSPRQVSTVTCKTLDVGNSVGESDKADCFHPSPKGEALSASSTSVAIGEVKQQVDTSSATNNTINDFALQIGPMELMGNSTNCLGKLGPENNFSDGYGSYPTQDGHLAGVGHLTEYDAGYDSSFEDGELREPGVYSWEENEVEGETECVDYGSDYGDGDDFDAVDYSLSENLETGRDGYQISKKEVSLAKNDDIEKIGIVGNRSAVDGESVKFLQQCFKGDHLKERSSSLSLRGKNSGADQFNEHLEYGKAEGNVDGHADKSLLAGEFGSRTSRENLSSYSKGFDALERKNMHPSQRSRYENSQYSYLRPERDFGIEKFAGRDKFSFKACGRNEADCHWVDSAAGYRETRNRYPYSYRGSEGHGYSRPRDVTANSGAKVSEMNSHGDRRSINYSSNGMYRPIMRRRPPADRDDSYGVQRGISPVKGIGRNGSRGSSGSYDQGIRRGPKEEYPEDMTDDATVPPVRRQQYFIRRERGFSPNYRPHRNSCSRSRTRSPVAWRDRNVGTRRRSPDLRSDTRMERMRSPFQKPSFAADNEEVFMSPPRGRLSPQSNSRWFDNGNYMDNHFRDRRSPVRMVRRSQRFDSVGYSGRLKSDGFFRPMSHRGRFHQASGTGRGRDFEESDDEKRKHYRYEMSHRVRRYDAGGAVRRFHYDTEDCFETRNSQNDDECFRRAIKRDIPRSGAREDRGQRYNSDRMYGSASSSGQRDFNDNAAVREDGPHDL